MNVFETIFSTKKSQVTVFIIIAIVIIVGVIAYILVRNGIILGGVPQEFEPVYNFYLGCIENEVRLASLIAGEHAGYIENPAFSPGSSYMPFSSQLDFLGNPVPYWYYISANNVVKEQVPSKTFIEEQMKNEG